MKYDLECRYDTRQSFYGKAQVRESKFNGYVIYDLFSYDTIVAQIIKYENGDITYRYYGKYSQTTTRHQKEFFKQNGLSDKQIKELFKNGILEV